MRILISPDRISRRWAFLTRPPSSTESTSSRRCRRRYRLRTARRARLSSGCEDPSTGSKFSFEKDPLDLVGDAHLAKRPGRRQGGNGGAVAPSRASGIIVRMHLEHRPQFEFISEKQTLKICQGRPVLGDLHDLVHPPCLGPVMDEPDVFIRPQRIGQRVRSQAGPAGCRNRRRERRRARSPEGARHWPGRSPESGSCSGCSDSRKRSDS